VTTVKDKKDHANNKPAVPPGQESPSRPTVPPGPDVDPDNRPAGPAPRIQP
jgi:hypothetical protein